MNKISCDIINDVLPLYVDGVVSNDTKNMVSEHLKSCETCRKKYEGMKGCVSLPIDSSERALKKFKSAWKRKKLFIFCLAIALTAAFMLTLSHVAFRAEISVNGEVYSQKGANVTVLPEGSVELGYLHSITHRTLSEPTRDFAGTNLSAKYAGCPLYRSGEDSSVIYLEDYGGFYIPFRLKE